jgi:hypothetical protein
MRSWIVRTVDLLYDVKTNWGGQNGGKWERQGSLCVTCELNICALEENDYRLMLSGH